MTIQDIIREYKSRKRYEKIWRHIPNWKIIKENIMEKLYREDIDKLDKIRIPKPNLKKLIKNKKSMCLFRNGSWLFRWFIVKENIR